MNPPKDATHYVELSLDGYKVYFKLTHIIES